MIRWKTPSKPASGSSVSLRMLVDVMQICSRLPERVILEQEKDDISSSTRYFLGLDSQHS